MYIGYSAKLDPQQFYNSHAVYVCSVNICGFFKKHSIMAYVDRHML
jgi:hypothetical protein